MITYEEYKQFKAYTRQDGAIIGAVMAFAFLALRASLTQPAMQLGYIIGMIAVPVLAYIRVKHYRDKVIMQSISKLRAFGYSMSCFMYASLILAMVAFLYFQYFDDGYFVSSLKSYFSMPEMQQAMEGYGVNVSEMKAQIDSFSTLRPVDVAFSMMANTFGVGLVCSGIIALFVRTKSRSEK